MGVVLEQSQRGASSSSMEESSSPRDSIRVKQLYAILEDVSSRIEMHKNIGKQRDNWNTLLLNSINMITLTATTMAGVSATSAAGVEPNHHLALNLSSTLLFSAAAGMLVLVNKIQPSQLAEEQRNASRLFKNLKNRIETMLAIENPSQEDVDDIIERVLALDRAFPLPLLGKMIEKFPQSFSPAVWWPKNDKKINKGKKQNYNNENGWSKELEMEMKEIVEVLRKKDSEDYMRLGDIALKINKILAISGPLLTGIAAMASALTCEGSCSWAPLMAVLSGSLASVVNTFEHGGQVGMVVEMYRNSAGFFKLLEETIESTLEEEDLERRENGKLFEMKVAMKLGRSLSQLRDLARKSFASRVEGVPLEEFGSRLF